jgi:oligopeptide transport system ATP-binding protein
MLFPPKGDAFAFRSKFAMGIDFKEEPPMYKLSDTHYAATWLLDPKAPTAIMPRIVEARIMHSLDKAGVTLDSIGTAPKGGKNA